MQLILALLALVSYANCVLEVAYSFPLKFDPVIWGFPSWYPSYLISRKRPTQLQGLVFVPNDFSRDHSHPVILMLPGSHWDCRYLQWHQGWGYYPVDFGVVDDAGQCPERERKEGDSGTQVVESHRGFRYLGQALADLGYFVVSIDPLMLQHAEPKPTGDSALIIPRARLALRTLQTLRVWVADAQSSIRGLGIDISGSIDFGQVGLFGHSRGGQAMRYAAKVLMNDAGLPRPERYDWKGKLAATVSGVFEVATTDFKLYGKEISIRNVPWSHVAAGCEEDVITYFDYGAVARQSRENVAPQYALTVYGATHAYFNSEWHTAYNDACLGDQTETWDTSVPHIDSEGRHVENTPLSLGSISQQRTLTWAAKAFFGAYVGQRADPSLALVLQSASPFVATAGTAMVSGVEIGYSNPNIARSEVLQNFLIADGVNVFPVTDPAPLTIDDHVEAQWQGYWQSLNNMMTTYAPPPNLAKDDAFGSCYLSPDAIAESGVAISISTASPNALVNIILNRPTNGPAASGVQCEVHVDVARRNTCYMLQDTALPFDQLIRNRKTCALPHLLDVVLNVGTQKSRPLRLKSRFNLEFGQYDFNRPADELYMIPVNWETIVAPCDGPTNRVSLSITSPDEGAGAATNGGGQQVNDEQQSILLIGQVRVTMT